MPYARIAAIAAYVPELQRTNAELAAQFAGFTEEKIFDKTGIRSRRIAAPDVYASDLGILAAERLLAQTGVARDQIDFLVLCSQSPDFLLPSTASKLHRALGLRKTAGTIDYAQGCAGYVYALGLVKGLIETGQAQTVLLVNADTMSKHLAPHDRAALSIFGDGAAATLVVGDAEQEAIGPFAHATDGAGREQITSYRAGLKAETLWDGSHVPPAHVEAAKHHAFYMNGPEVFRFTLAEIPALLAALAAKRPAPPDAHYVFHQANGFMLKSLRQICKIPEAQFHLHLEDLGNTSSCSIPLALEHGIYSGRIKRGDRAVLVGFGVGYAAAATYVSL